MGAVHILSVCGAYSSLLLLLVLNISSVASEKSFFEDASSEVVSASRSLELTFSEAAKLIEKHIESKGLERNLDGVLRAVEDLGVSKKDHRQLELLMAFENLPSILDLCNKRAYLLLATLNRVANTSKLQTDGSELIRLAIEEALRKHSQNCQSKYFQLFVDSKQAAAAAAANSGEMIAKVEQALDGRVMNALYPANSKLIEVVADDSLMLSKLQDVRQALGENVNELERAQGSWLGFAVNKIAASHYRLRSASEPLKQFEQCANKFVKLLFIPCERFVATFEDVFLPARLDLMVSADDGATTKMSGEINPTNDQNFEASWKRFMICGLLNRNVDGSLQKVCNQTGFVTRIIGRASSNALPT